MKTYWMPVKSRGRVICEAKTRSFSSLTEALGTYDLLKILNQHERSAVARIVRQYVMSKPPVSIETLRGIQIRKGKGPSDVHTTDTARR